MEAVKQNGLALQYAAANLQNDRELIMQAIKQKWRSLEFASGAPQDHREVATAPIQH